MSGKVKASLLAAAIVAAGAASQAQASFTYDLRLAPGQGQLDSHTVTSPVAGTNYTLQLWAQITGDTDPTNDLWNAGYVGLQSVQGANPLIATGGVTSGSAASHVAGSGFSNGAQGNISADGLTDWGSSSTTNTTGWIKWISLNGDNLFGGTGFKGGTADAESKAVNSTTWEVLVANFVVNVGTLNAAGTETDFNLMYSPGGNKQGTTLNKSVIYYQDGSGTQHNNSTDTVTVGPGVAFVQVPEPASLGVLALGALGLLARRRK